MPKSVSYNTYYTKQTFGTQEQMFGIYRLTERNAKRNRPYFFDAPFELFCCPDLKLPVAAGRIFRCLGFGKSGTVCCRRCRGAYGKRVLGCGDASRRRRNPPLCRRPASNFANGSVLPLDLGKVTFVTFGQDFGEKGTVFELFSCVFGNPRHTISPVESVIRV